MLKKTLNAIILGGQGMIGKRSKGLGLEFKF